MAPNNPLVAWGNDKTMNLNTLILTNIQSSPYFKVQLFELKTFHEVVDEIYYRVDHLEPWEKGSRKTAGQTGMCGGVRGVGAGGIVSSAYCLLFKLFTLKLTKKQVNNLITHSDSPFIRGLGFMYIRYTQPPPDLWDWYEPFLDDEEELDVKAGGGHTMTIGEMLRQWLVKLEWYSTLFPRIPVPIQKDLDVKLRSRPVTYGYQGYGDQGPQQEMEQEEPQHIPDEDVSFGEAEKAAMSQRGRGGSGGRGSYSGGGGDRGYRGGGRGSFGGGGGGSNVRDNYRNNSQRSPPRRGHASYDRRSRSPRRSPPRSRASPNRARPADEFSRELERHKERQRREREEHKRSKHRSRSRERKKSRSRSRDRKRSPSKERRERSNSGSPSDRRDKEHKRTEKKKHKHKSKDKDRERRY